MVRKTSCGSGPRTIPTKFKNIFYIHLSSLLVKEMQAQNSH